MEYVATVLFSSLEVLFLLAFWNVFLTARGNGLKYIFAVIIGCVFANLYPLSAFLYEIRSLVSVALFFGLCSWLFEGKWYWKLLLAVLGYVIIAIAELILTLGLCAALGISFGQLQGKKILYITVVAMAKLLCAFAAWLCSRGRRTKARKDMHLKWLLLTVLFPAVSIVILALVLRTAMSAPDVPLELLWIVVMLTVANVGIIYLLGVMERNVEESRATALLRQQTQLQTESIQALTDSYSAQRKQVHEFNKHLETVSVLLSEGHLERAKQYIQQIDHLRRPQRLVIDSKNPVVDAVLNPRYYQAVEQDIDIYFQINDLSELPIPEESLVVLLANLLDNAIEACAKVVGPREIVFTMVKEDGIRLSVVNTSLPVSFVNGELPSTKTDPSNHGFGMRAIRIILQELHAEYIIRWQDGRFFFASEIPLP